MIRSNIVLPLRALTSTNPPPLDLNHPPSSRASHGKVAAPVDTTTLLLLVTTTTFIIVVVVVGVFNN